MEGVDPIINMGQVRWYKKPMPGKSYVIGLDPSMGTGGDFAEQEARVSRSSQ